MSGNHADSHHQAAHAPLPPDEPRTPMWLPALGAVLFLLAGLWWGLSSSSTAAAPNAAPSASAANAK